MADDADTTESGSDVDGSQDGKKPKKKLVFEEDLLFTAEEKEQRRLERLGMSSCCIAEAWNYYRGITNLPRKKDAYEIEVNLPMSILYDPTIIKAREYLKRKYKLINDGFNKIKEAPYFPYIRPHPPRNLDLPGRRLSMPCVARVQMPEAFVDYTQPRTISYTAQKVKVYNTVFTNDVDTKVASTQVGRQDLQDMGRIEKQVQIKHDDDIAFSYDDYPLDDQGNPIGKTTGYCEWCSKEILPLPTPWALRNKWDKSRLYCCKKYQAFIEKAVEYERKIMAELAAKNLLIDISPHAKRVKPGSKKGKSGKSGGASDGKSDGAETEEERKALQRKREREELLKKKKMDQEAAEKAAERARAERIKNSKTIGLDTFDLPWDPYETRFGHRKYFNDQVFDESIFHCYPHADVVLSQSEIYIEAAWDGEEVPVESTEAESPEDEQKDQQP